MAPFQFIMRSGPLPGKVYPIDGTELTIGRDNSNAIAINDVEVSRKHARMELRGSAYVIQDLGSTNGTFINGNRTTGMQVLNPNDIVSFGENIVLIYQATSDPNATMLSASKAASTVAAMQKPTPATPAPAPIYQSAAPAPVRQSAAPVKAYSGQVPAGPEASATEPVKKKGGLKIVLLLLAVLMVCVIVGCGGFMLWIDADKSGARWCQYLPFLAEWLGAVCT